MKALVMNEFDSTPVLEELPDPEPGAGQVRVRVRSAGLNKIDAMISGGMLKGMAEYHFPVVLGRDVAGTVDAIGSGVDHVSVGDEVIGHVLMDGTLHHGTLAEYAIVPADGVVPKPANLGFDEAAALPLAAAAALAAVDAVDLTPGGSVLIVGASGGVGEYAVQLAASKGATVLATGLPEDGERLRGLGASDVLDYRQDVVALVRQTRPDGVDGLIDLVSYDAESLGTLATAVREGGRIASTLNAADAEALAARAITGTNIMASPDRRTLTSLVELIERGDLRVAVDQTLPLDQAIRGLETLATGQARGKIVCTLSDGALPG